MFMTTSDIMSPLKTPKIHNKGMMCITQILPFNFILVYITVHYLMYLHGFHDSNQCVYVMF